MQLNPLDIIFWTFRRNEKDVVNLYNTLSPVMQLAVGGDMLNFGYWGNGSTTPIDAQQALCSKVGKLGELDSAKNMIDVGSGVAGPARFWSSEYPELDIICVNTNFTQLQNAVSGKNLERINQHNSTSTNFPFASDSIDRVIALESAQHFKDFDSFISESKRILKNNGILVIAIPVASKFEDSLMKLGILSFTWSSEHYSIDFIKTKLKDHNLEIMEIDSIGEKVYSPLTKFYTQNRKEIKQNLNSVFPSYLEKILYKSLLKMKEVSESKTIDYVLIKCKKVSTSITA